MPITLTRMLSFLLASGMALPVIAARDNVEQWGIFELALKGPAAGNPFLDIRFTARRVSNRTTIVR